MQDLLLQLLNLIKYEVSKYQELLEVLYQERQFLVEREIAELPSLVAQEESLIQHIKSAEEIRDEMIAELVAFPEIGAKPMNATTIIEIADESLKSDYVEVFDQIRSVKTEFDYINKTNKQLLQSEYDYVSFLIDQVAKIGEPGDTYEDDGRLRSPSGKGLFDHRI